MPPLTRPERSGPAWRSWYRMKGGPWDRKELAPPVGASTAELVIGGRRHVYQLDHASLTGAYRGEPDAGPDPVPMHRTYARR